MRPPSPDYLIAHAVANMGIPMRQARRLIRVLEWRMVHDPVWDQAMAVCESAMNH